MGDIFKIKEFSNENYYSWKRPKYWRLKSATIKSLDDKTIISSKNNLLHVLMHSMPIEDEISFDDLKDHLFVEETHDFIPYRTSYYKENWGFCVNNKQLQEIQKHKKLKVKIESSLEDHPVPYGDCVINGNSDNEILITSYICHPNMANNELSGILLIVRLIKMVEHLSKKGLLPLTIRFLLAPETFGSIAYINENYKHLLNNTKGVIVCSCVGDGRKVSLVRGRLPREFYSCLKLCSMHVANEKGLEFSEYDFLDRGADERQFASPHVALDVGTLCNTKFGDYPEYHTSADNLDIISESAISMSSEIIIRTIIFYSQNNKPILKEPCEPMFSRFGIYPHTRNYSETKKEVMNLLNFSAYSDGTNYLHQIADKCSLSDLETLGLLTAFKENGVLK